MQYIDEFRDPKIAKTLTARIREVLQATPDTHKPLQIMEVCGGHTHTLFRYGLPQLLPEGIEFIHGPGCPVCVLPKSRIDQCIALAELSDTIFCTFGDAMRVPGSQCSLLDARARGSDIRIVYSPMDALDIALANPDKRVVFFALGFETTMPATAVTLQRARQKQVTNFSVFCQHITIMPVLSALLSQNDVRIDGFLLPGHLSVIIGTHPYQPLADKFHRPCVVAGFEPVDMLHALLMLLMQFQQGICEIQNQYARVVTSEGNQSALQAMADVFTVKRRNEWLGLGVIPDSGVKLTERYRQFDAERFITSPIRTPPQPKTRCGDVLAGRCKPTDCPLFAKECIPEHAAGPLMVSGEGACAAYYHYRDSYTILKN